MAVRGRTSMHPFAHQNTQRYALTIEQLLNAPDLA